MQSRTLWQRQCGKDSIGLKYDKIMYGHQLQEVIIERDLGVHMSSDLKVGCQCMYDVGIQTVWECILPINIPRTFLASRCDLFRFSSRFCVFYFRIWITSGIECVQLCRCARRACVRARSLACWHGNRRHMTSCFAVGDALLVDGVHYSSCCHLPVDKLCISVDNFLSSCPWVQVCPRCQCLHVFPSFGSWSFVINLM